MDIIFYTTGCPKCNVLKKKMDAVGLEYTINSNVDEMLDLGIQTAPYLKVNDELLDFSRAVVWLKENF